MLKGFQKLSAIKPGSFNDEAYLQAFLKQGEFPAIHQDFGAMVRTCANEPEPSIDLGTCTGLMSIQNIQNGRSSCVGIEGNEFDFSRCLPYQGVRYENFYVNDHTLDRLDQIIRKEKVTLVTARRVFYDIGYADATIINRLSALFARAGVKKIVLQGRVKVKKPAKPELNSSEAEAARFAKEYRLAHAYKDVFVLNIK